jgi:DNA-binding LacI/PurR family transcriptional regulator
VLKSVLVINDVARHASVSVVTIHHIINGRDVKKIAVSEGAHPRVQGAISELGDVPKRRNHQSAPSRGWTCKVIFQYNCGPVVQS